MIWKQVLLDGSSNGVLHIILKDHALSHIQCSAPQDGYNTSRVVIDSWGTEHEHCYCFPGTDNEDSGSVKQCRVLSLLLRWPANLRMLRLDSIFSDHAVSNY